MGVGLSKMNLQVDNEMGRGDNVKNNDKTSPPGEADSGWKNQSYLALMIENIPGHWMAADLKDFLDSFGNVVKVEIFEDRDVSTPRQL